MTAMENGYDLFSHNYGGFNSGAAVTNWTLWDNPFSYGIFSANDAGACGSSNQKYYLNPRKFAFAFESLVDAGNLLSTPSTSPPAQHQGIFIHDGNLTDNAKDEVRAGISFYKDNCLDISKA